MCVICVHMQWMPKEGVRSLGGRGLLWGIYSLFPLRDLGIELRLSSLRDKHYHGLNHFWDHVHFFFKFFIFLCVCDHGSMRVGMPVPQHSCGAQRTTWGCWVSLSTTWAWRLNSGQQAWPQAPLCTEPSCQPPSVHFKHKWTGIDSFLGLAKPH